MLSVAFLLLPFKIKLLLNFSMKKSSLLTASSICCVCFVTFPPHECTKFESRPCLYFFFFLKSYCCYDLITNRFCVSRHVEFWEHKMFTSVYEFATSSSIHSPIFIDPSIALPPDSSTKTSSS